MTDRVEAYLCRLSRALEPIRTPTLKLGGTPVFLSEVDWPTCNHCGGDMDFLAQVPLQSPIRFSEKYQMAYVFMCPGKFDERGWLECETWAPNAGANAVIVQEGPGEATLPHHVPRYPDYATALEHVQEPSVDTSDYRIDESVLEEVHESTKIGGVPLWLQDNATPVCPVCGVGMQFIAQFDAALDGPLPANPKEWGERYKFLEFGDAGQGYLFLCSGECDQSRAAFLWQCT